MKTKSLFIFDLDGTLVDAYEAIEKSLNFVLKKLRCPTVTLEKVKRNVGRGDRLFIETFFPSIDVGEVLKIYRAHHEKSLLRYSRAKPGARKLLRLLKKRKRLIAVASNRPSYFTDIILKRLKLEDLVDYTLCADRIKSRKPDPKILNLILKRFKIKRQGAVFVGDMDIDVETAKRAGMDAVFIKGGSSTLASVRKYRNKKVISNIMDVARLYG